MKASDKKEKLALSLSKGQTGSGRVGRLGAARWEGTATEGKRQKRRWAALRRVTGCGALGGYCNCEQIPPGGTNAAAWLPDSIRSAMKTGSTGSRFSVLVLRFSLSDHLSIQLLLPLHSLAVVFVARLIWLVGTVDMERQGIKLRLDAKC